MDGVRTLCLTQITHPVFAQPLNLPSLPLCGKEGFEKYLCSYPLCRAARERVDQRSVVEVSQRSERYWALPPAGAIRSYACRH